MAGVRTALGGPDSGKNLSLISLAFQNTRQSYST